MGPTDVTAEYVLQRLCCGESIFVVDVRPSDAFEEWHMKSAGLTIVNVPWSLMKQSGESALSGLPKDRRIIVVCAKGISAAAAAEHLLQAGYDAVTMTGGMLAWSQVYRTDHVAETQQYDIWQVCRPAKGCLSYVVRVGHEALVVDPGRHVDVYLQVAEREGVQVRMIVDTHLHADHVSGARELRDRTRADYQLAEAHAGWSGLLSVGGGVITIEQISTPGHTPGSASLLIDGQYLLSGDTVFVRGVGRPDLHGQAVPAAGQLYRTVRALRGKLRNDAWILPAHYVSEDERNEFRFVGALWEDVCDGSTLLSVVDERRFVTQVTGQMNPTPPNYDRVLAVNRGELMMSSQELTDLETGPNRCAVT